MVGFMASLVLLCASVGGALAYGRRRPPGSPLSWGEAAVAGTLVFFVMFLAYGVVPHQWLTWADNELNWRADRLVAGPGRALARLPFDVTYQVVRDIVAAGLYVVFLGAHVVLWSVWQNRGKVRAKEIELSSYGRPLVKEA